MLRPKNLSVGDRLEFIFEDSRQVSAENSKREPVVRKKVRGVIEAMTAHLLVVVPDKRYYEAERVTVSYADIFAGFVKCHPVKE